MFIDNETMVGFEHDDGNHESSETIEEAHDDAVRERIHTLLDRFEDNSISRGETSREISEISLDIEQKVADLISDFSKRLDRDMGHFAGQNPKRVLAMRKQASHLLEDSRAIFKSVRRRIDKLIKRGALDYVDDSVNQDGEAPLVSGIAKEDLSGAGLFGDGDIYEPFSVDGDRPLYDVIPNLSDFDGSEEYSDLVSLDQVDLLESKKGAFMYHSGTGITFDVREVLSDENEIRSFTVYNDPLSRQKHRPEFMEIVYKTLRENNTLEVLENWAESGKANRFSRQRLKETIPSAEPKAESDLGSQPKSESQPIDDTAAAGEDEHTQQKSSSVTEPKTKKGKSKPKERTAPEVGYGATFVNNEPVEDPAKELAKLRRGAVDGMQEMVMTFGYTIDEQLLDEMKRQYVAEELSEDAFTALMVEARKLTGVVEENERGAYANITNQRFNDLLREHLGMESPAVEHAEVVDNKELSSLDELDLSNVPEEAFEFVAGNGTRVDVRAYTEDESELRAFVVVNSELFNSSNCSDEVLHNAQEIVKEKRTRRHLENLAYWQGTKGSGNIGVGKKRGS